MDHGHMLIAVDQRATESWQWILQLPFEDLLAHVYETH